MFLKKISIVFCLAMSLVATKIACATKGADYAENELCTQVNKEKEEFLAGIEEGPFKEKMTTLFQDIDEETFSSVEGYCSKITQTLNKWKSIDVERKFDKIKNELISSLTGNTSSVDCGLFFQKASTKIHSVYYYHTEEALNKAVSELYFEALPQPFRQSISVTNENRLEVAKKFYALCNNDFLNRFYKECRGCIGLNNDNVILASETDSLNSVWDLLMEDLKQSNKSDEDNHGKIRNMFKVVFERINTLDETSFSMPSSSSEGEKLKKKKEISFKDQIKTALKGGNLDALVPNDLKDIYRTIDLSITEENIKQILDSFYKSLKLEGDEEIKDPIEMARYISFAGDKEKIRECYKVFCNSYRQNSGAFNFKFEKAKTINSLEDLITTIQQDLRKTGVEDENAITKVREHVINRAKGLGYNSILDDFSSHVASLINGSNGAGEKFKSKYEKCAKAMRDLTKKVRTIHTWDDRVPVGLIQEIDNLEALPTNEMIDYWKMIAKVENLYSQLVAIKIPLGIDGGLIPSVDQKTSKISYPQQVQALSEVISKLDTDINAHYQKACSQRTWTYGPTIGMAVTGGVIHRGFTTPSPIINLITSIRGSAAAIKVSDSVAPTVGKFSEWAVQNIVTPFAKYGVPNVVNTMFDTMTEKQARTTLLLGGAATWFVLGGGLHYAKKLCDPKNEIRRGFLTGASYGSRAAAVAMAGAGICGGKESQKYATAGAPLIIGAGAIIGSAQGAITQFRKN